MSYLYRCIGRAGHGGCHQSQCQGARPSVCNSMETLLVHADYAKSHLTVLAEAFRERNVESRMSAYPGLRSLAKATPEDYATEYNDYILNIKIVDHLDEAIEHISIYGTKHSECIVAEDKDHARASCRK